MSGGEERRGSGEVSEEGAVEGHHLGEERRGSGEASEDEGRGWLGHKQGVNNPPPPLKLNILQRGPPQLSLTVHS